MFATRHSRAKARGTAASSTAVGVSADSDTGTGCLPLTAPRRAGHHRAITVHRDGRQHPRETVMLKWAIIFALISVVAGVLGFTGVAAGAAAIAKVLFFIFFALFVIFLVLGLFVYKSLGRSHALR